jgi:hypothetical protein
LEHSYAGCLYKKLPNSAANGLIDALLLLHKDELRSMLASVLRSAFNVVFAPQEADAQLTPMSTTPSLRDEMSINAILSSDSGFTIIDAACPGVSLDSS